jgi:AcrR family transcriptional regulator
VGDQSTDRRVRRTRALLHQALFDLILEKGYDNTTVQDILDRADVGRSTFYNHYPTKDQLLLSGLDELCDAIHRAADQPNGHHGLLGPLRPVFDHVEEHDSLFRAMLGDRASSLTIRAGRRVLAETVTEHLRKTVAIDDEDEFELTVAFLVDSLIGVLTWWRLTHPDLPTEHVYNRYVQLVTQGLEPNLADLASR